MKTTYFLYMTLAISIIAQTGYAVCPCNKKQVAARYEQYTAQSQPLSQTQTDAPKTVLPNQDVQNIRKTLAQEIEEHAELSIFTQALKYAGVSDMLNEGNYTVFAPTNQAFDDLDEQLNELLKPENKETLKNVLLHHIVVGTYKSNDFKNDQEIIAADQEPLHISVENNTPLLEDIGLKTTDIETNNGVIHIIDSAMIK